MTMVQHDCLIVGAGHAGAQCAIALRQEGFAGSIAIAGDEPDLPYERPPLSKDYLAGQRPPERLLIRPPAFWAERGIAHLPSTRIVAVEPGAATTAEGQRIAARHIVWAAGGHARRLSCPGADLGGVHVIRTRAEVDRLKADLATAARVLVVGGGYIGLEAAAVLAATGRAITLVEAQERLLARVSAPEVSSHVLALHRAHGVDVRLGLGVAGLEGDGRVNGAILGNGSRIAADVVIAGIGLEPATAGMEGATDGGEIRVDGHCRTAMPGVWAIGDCASHQSRWADGAWVRIESVQNAADMGRAAARSIVHGAAAAPYADCPWFWSNQHDMKLQTVGLARGHDSVVVRGDPDQGAGWSLVYLRAGAVVALDCINAPRDYVQGRALVERGARIDPRRLADPAVPLKSMEG